MDRGVHVFFTTASDGCMIIGENRRRFLKEQGLAGFLDITMTQTHGDNIVIVDEDYQVGTTADGLITHLHNHALFCKGADCLPILFYDPKNRVIGAAHCGCRGTYACLAQKMISKFVSVFGSDSRNIIVRIGPGVGACCYSVDFELHDLERFGSEFVRGRHVDLAGINRKQLIDFGVREENIDVINICTCCNKNYFSHQRAKNQGLEKHKGNNAGIIALR